MKKHKIQIIKEFDLECKFAYKGSIPYINVDNFYTQSFYGFNEFQIIDGDTLSREDEKNCIYFKGIDFTYALDSNAVSYFVRYATQKDIRYEDLYNQVKADGNNIDIFPYIFEIVMHGFMNFGVYYKLNKKNKNETQTEFFRHLEILYKEGLFKEKLAKIFINKIIKNHNKLIEMYGVIGYQAKIFLLCMIEAKFKFGKSSNKIIEYVYTELRKAKIPIENKIKAILYVFVDNPNHPFLVK